MAAKLRMAIVGGGKDSLVGILHRVASSMFDQYVLCGGVFDADFSRSRTFAEAIGLDANRIYPDLGALIRQENALPENRRVQVVSILTPNFLHFPMAKKLLENGFHVICEKPLTTTYGEARILEEMHRNSKTVFAVTYTYTGYPMVRQMREMIAGGAVGKIQKIDVQYYQGWLNPIVHDAEKRASTWRLDPEKSGTSCCIGDVGTHAFDMIEYVSGLQVNEILADLNYLYGNNLMDLDGTVLLRFSEYVKGVLRASQIASGEENNFTVSVYGDKAGLKWEQENPNYLHLLEDGEPIRVFKPGNAYNSELSLDGTKMPPGHPEGIFDAMGNIYKGVAKAIRKEKYHPAEFPTITDGLRGLLFVEKAVESHRSGNTWVRIEEPSGNLSRN